MQSRVQSRAASGAPLKGVRLNLKGWRDVSPQTDERGLFEFRSVDSVSANSPRNCPDSPLRRTAAESLRSAPSASVSTKPLGFPYRDFGGAWAKSFEFERVTPERLGSP